ncbi:MAG: hypothetical protein NTV46_00205 [Verrucomicrobia bacterium]|nr:hypothetical protein [Verrucomicrobiota bacterium]
MKKQMIIKWAFHLVGAVCIAGTVALLFTFCSEVLFRDRGALDQSLMTWEDFYGAVITTLLAIGLLLVPLQSFSFRSIRVWLGAAVMASALTAVAYVLAAPVELTYFHADNFIISIGLLAFVGFLCGFSGRYGKKNQA